MKLLLDGKPHYFIAAILILVGVVQKLYPPLHITFYDIDTPDAFIAAGIAWGGKHALGKIGVTSKAPGPGND
jgi:hypothetical protein